MAKRIEDEGQPADQQAPSALPPGVKLLHSLEGHNDVVNCVAFDPRSGTLASASDDRTVKLWDARSGKLLRTLEGHNYRVYSVAFDPQGETLASGTFGTVKLWDVRSGGLLRTLEVRNSNLYSVAFDPRSGMLAGGGFDGTVRLWEMPSGKLLRTIEGNGDQVLSVALDPRGETLACGCVNNANLWDPVSRKLLHTLEGIHAVYSVAFDRTGLEAMSTTIEIKDSVYGKLLAKSLPRPIHSRAEHARLTEMLLQLDEREDLSPEEEALAEVLTLLIEDYEEKYHPLPGVSPNESLNALMEERGLKHKDIWPVLGNKGAATEVLSGRRSISKAQAKRLAEFFHVPVDLFI